MPIDIAGYGRDVRTLLDQRNLGERLKQPNGLMLVLQQLGDVFDEKRKQKHQEKMAKAGEDATNARQKVGFEHDTSERVAGETFRSTEDQAKFDREQKAKQAELDRQTLLKQQRQEPFDRLQHAEDQLYAHPSDPHVYDEFMPEVLKARRELIALEVDKATLADSELSNIHKMRYDLRTEKATTHGAHLDEIKAEATKEFLHTMRDWHNDHASWTDVVRAAGRASASGNTSDYVKAVLEHDSGNGEQLSPEDQAKALNRVQEAAKISKTTNLATGELMPTGYGVNPDSTQLGDFMITAGGGGLPDSATAAKARQQAPSFLKRKRDSSIEAWAPTNSTTQIITGATTKADERGAPASVGDDLTGMMLPAHGEKLAKTYDEAVAKINANPKIIDKAKAIADAKKYFGK